jgi:hypothetical protein
MIIQRALPWFVAVEILDNFWRQPGASAPRFDLLKHGPGPKPYPQRSSMFWVGFWRKAAGSAVPILPTYW